MSDFAADPPSPEIEDPHPRVGARPVPSCLVRAGTSRFIVVDRRHAPPGASDREIAAGLFGSTVADGLGGDHYQLNKLAIWRATAENEVDFTFFALAPGSREVCQGAECGHAAVAVARVVAEEEERHGTPIGVRNVDTGQRMEIAPESAGDGFDGQCRGTIVHEPALPPIEAMAMGPIPGHGERPRWEVVHAGNVFGLVPGISTCDDQPRRRRIQAETLDCARQAGVRNASPEFVRTIAFDLQWLSETRARIDAVCHNGDQRHNSLPLSGCAALCNRLSCLRIEELRIDQGVRSSEIAFDFDARSPSGAERVGVSMRFDSGSWRIHATSNSTSVRMLLRGEAFLSS